MNKAVKLSGCLIFIIGLIALTNSNALAQLDAAVDSHTIPATMAPGEIREIAITMTNNGTENWVFPDHTIQSINDPYNLWKKWVMYLDNGETITPGSSKTFTLFITAPAPDTPKTYTCNWQMNILGVGFFGAMLETDVLVSASTIPAMDARVISHTIPTCLAPGEEREVSVTMENSGASISWEYAYHSLQSQNDPNNFWLKWLNLLDPGETVDPGATRTFTFTITAPDTPGNYICNWQMHISKSFGSLFFGELLETTVEVGVCQACTNGETQPCPVQDGVCSGSEEVCTDSQWPGCDYSTLPDYEAIETTCGDALDNDCDTFADLNDTDCQACTNGETQPCPVQDGVCSGSEEVCTDSQWLGCDYSTLPDYEPIETTCGDGLDNDCDTFADLNDTDCQACTNGETQPCPIQDGVCSGSEEVCTDSQWPGCDYSTLPDYEPTETTCGDGLDNDCDTFADLNDTDCQACTNGETQLCPVQDGVCSGSEEVCTDSQWPGCDYTTLPDYEATETTCDGLDNDCDRAIDENIKNTYHRDLDGDSYGNPSDSELACTAPAGFVEDNTDCNDSRPSIYPGAYEICNGEDENCNNLIDDACDLIGIVEDFQTTNPDSSIVVVDEDADNILVDAETFNIGIVTPTVDVCAIADITDLHVSPTELPPTVHYYDESYMNQGELDAAIQTVEDLVGYSGELETINILEIDSSQLTDYLGTDDYDLLIEIKTSLLGDALEDAVLMPYSKIIFCNGEYNLEEGICSESFVSVDSKCTSDLLVEMPTVEDICYRPMGFDPDTVEVQNIPHGTSIISVVMQDTTAPEVQIIIPYIADALQDGVIFKADASDISGVVEVNLHMRELYVDDGSEYEGLFAAELNTATGLWEYDFDTTQLNDGYYAIMANAVDLYGNQGWSDTVPFSIRNWAVLELLPTKANNKAGRTMPVKFSLRITESVDPAMPFVYNEELEIRIYDTANPATILQTSLFGDSSSNYRIDSIGEKYITNFKTAKKPAEYVVEIWRPSNEFLVGAFTFETVK